MRLLFEMDRKDYSQCTSVIERPSARSIIIRENRIAMVHSAKYDYYKFPGGGIEAGETVIDALIRETREETGFAIDPKTIQEYGMVHRIQKSMRDESQCFIQDNYYYLCEASEEVTQELDDYEAEEGYTVVFVDARDILKKNRSVKDSPYHPDMFEREAKVVEFLLQEGYVRL